MEKLKIGDVVYPLAEEDLEDLYEDCQEEGDYSQNIKGIIDDIMDDDGDEEPTYSVVWTNSDTGRVMFTSLKCAWFDAKSLTKDRNRFLKAYKKFIKEYNDFWDIFKD